MESMLQKARIHIRGIVQGVGFRPFVFNLAREHGISGYVLNDSTGVHIEAIAPPEAIEKFLRDLREKAPPQAAIYSMEVKLGKVSGAQKAPRDFVIKKSRRLEVKFVPISPDIATCHQCVEELFDEDNFRFGYPFINCTNCGPRFTIIRDIPYDRDKTTMQPFEMCRTCAAEYDDPANRRFHAQPNACPACGPKVSLMDNRGKPVACEDPIEKCAGLLRKGRIVAIKGLGGFHLACDATNHAAVTTLRKRKYREDKPFALMMRTLGDIERHCYVSEADRRLLTSPRRPIVLMRKRGLGFGDRGSGVGGRGAGSGDRGSGVGEQGAGSGGQGAGSAEQGAGSGDRGAGSGEQGAGSGVGESPVSTPNPRPQTPNPTAPLSLVSDAVAPNQKRLGVMLPYTPLHHLLLEKSGLILVLTSGNVSDEPISYVNEEAFSRLHRIADYFLTNNREIYMRCDDSVTTTFRGKESVLRRSRGYVPEPFILPFSSKRHVLACGAELNNTFCLTRDNYFFVSHHIGDLENVETLRSFEEGIEHFKKLFFIEPKVIAYDLHPEYLSTKYALAQTAVGRKMGVQHHYAHIVSCMADNSLSSFLPSGEPRKVIGVAFDGIGYGDDGSIWGGEFFIAGYFGYRRAAHLKNAAMPGGEAAIKQPWRMAASFLRATYGDSFLDIGVEFTKRIDRASWEVIQKAIDLNVNCFETSSMGRLFDAVSALIGVRDEIHYEGQAAIELEYLADEKCRKAYSFKIRKEGETYIIDWRPIFRQVIRDLAGGETKGTIASKFHNAVARMIVEVCRRLRHECGIEEVALSGGVFQNVYLLGRTVPALERNGFRVHVHHRVPTNDGGISLGQAAFACLNQ